MRRLEINRQDVYDPLANKRVYEEAYSHDMAKSIITNDNGAHFDPIRVDGFLSCEESFIETLNRFKDN